MDVPQGAGDLGTEPVVDPIRYRVEGGVGGIDGDACSGAAEEGSLEGVGKGEGREWLEDWWMVRDDDGSWSGEGLLYDLWGETVVECHQSGSYHVESVDRIRR